MRVRLSPTRLGGGETEITEVYETSILGSSPNYQTGLSSNGRMLVSETNDHGSNPCGPILAGGTEIYDGGCGTAKVSTHVAIGV